MKKIVLYIGLLLMSVNMLSGQEDRFLLIKQQLDSLAIENRGFNENIKSEINVANVTLTNFLLAISEVHEVNINVDPKLSQIAIINNFTNVTVRDLLLFLCKEHNLTIDFSGNILSVHPYIPPAIIEERIIPITYTPGSNTISIDAKNDKLYDVFRKIMDESGKNLVFTPGLENKSLTFYGQNLSFDAAMNKLALANDLYLEKTKDDFYVFENGTSQVTSQQLNAEANTTTTSRRRPRGANFHFKVIDPEHKLLEVNFTSTPIEHIISDIAEQLDLDIFTATPLSKAGTATFKAKKISFDDLLVKLFEIQTSAKNTSTDQQRNANNNVTQQASTIFTFKKENNIYYLGTEDQLSVRKVEIVPLQYRSVELLNDPSGNNLSNRYFGGNRNNNFGNNRYNQFDNFDNRNREQVNTRNGNFNNYDNTVEALINILPDEVKNNLDIKIDYELNSFFVNGPATNVERFKKFIKEIDKPIPVVLIEVMIIEVNKSSTIEAGVDFGIGEAPVETRGQLFPEYNMTLGANTVNRIIGSFNDFASFNLGKVGPNFYANIKALETNGDLKIRSTPRLATLNSHRAVFSNSQTSFYAVTQRNIYGTDNPQTSEITNYHPIDAELSLSIKPSVTGDGQVILDLNVIQSSFGGRIAEDAPPDINSRSFSSIVRMKDQDIAILGGIEEQYTNNSGSGVPFLAKIPLIKWLFSKRVREGRKSKLTVLIRPMIIK